MKKITYLIKKTKSKKIKIDKIQKKIKNLTDFKIRQNYIKYGINMKNYLKINIYIDKLEEKIRELIIERKKIYNLDNKYRLELS